MALDDSLSITGLTDALVAQLGVVCGTGSADSGNWLPYREVLTDRASTLTRGAGHAWVFEAVAGP